MHIVNLLFSFHGRVNRTQYWLGNLAVGGVLLMVSVMVGVSAATAAAANKGDPAALMNNLGISLGMLSFTTLLNILATWCSLSIQVKRFHDRGRTGWLAVIPFVLLIWIVGSIVGSAMTQQPVEQALSAIGLPCLLFVLVSIAFFIDLGCLAGQPGPNRFGDPSGTSPTTQFKPQGGAPAPSSLNNAASALDAAIAQRKAPDLSALGMAPRSAAATAQRAPAPVLARPAAPASFGRRTTS